MKYIYLVLNWALGGLLLLAGLVMLATVPLAGLVLVLASSLLLPPARQWAFAKTGRSLSPKQRATALFILFIALNAAVIRDGVKKDEELAAQEEKKRVEQAALEKKKRIDDFIGNKDEIISEIKSAIDSSDYKKAVAVSSKYIEAGDAEVANLNSSAKARLAEVQTQELTEKLLSDLKKLPESSLQQNRSIYEQLVGMYPDNKDYQLKLSHYNAMLQEEQAAALRAEQRKKGIEHQFSSWDGSHRALERVIKDSMNDPDSYEHVETVYWDQADHIVVRTTFRGKNAFGGVVKNSVKAKVSLDGQVLELMDQ